MLTYLGVTIRSYHFRALRVISHCVNKNIVPNSAIGNHELQILLQEKIIEDKFQRFQYMLRPH